jgi:hypothetical protein
MSGIARFAVLTAALLPLFGALSSSVSATTWHNAGGTNFTATGGFGTLSVTGAQLRWTGWDMTGNAPTLSTALTYTIAGNSTITGFTISGIPFSPSCGYTITLTNAALNHVFTGNMDLTCSIADTSGTKVCHLEGLTPVHYRNAETGLAAQLTLTTSTTLRLTNGGAGVNCPLGAGEATHMTQQTFNVTSSPAPTIVRT